MKWSYDEQQLASTPSADCTCGHPSMTGDGVTHHDLFHFSTERLHNSTEYMTYLWFRREGESPIPQNMISDLWTVLPGTVKLVDAETCNTGFGSS